MYTTSPKARDRSELSNMVNSYSVKIVGSDAPITLSDEDKKELGVASNGPNFPSSEIAEKVRDFLRAKGSDCYSSSNSPAVLAVAASMMKISDPSNGTCAVVLEDNEKVNIEIRNGFVSRVF